MHFAEPEETGFKAATTDHRFTEEVRPLSLFNSLCFLLSSLPSYLQKKTRRRVLRENITYVDDISLAYHFIRRM